MALGLRPLQNPSQEQAFDWTHIAKLHPHKLLVDIQAYGALLVRCIPENEGSKAMPEGIKPSALFGPYSTQTVSFFHSCLSM